MNTTKLLTPASLHHIVEDLLNKKSPNRDDISNKAKDSLLELFISSKESRIITPAQLYDALNKTKLNDIYSPHDEFLAINNNWQLDFIKPHNFTQEQKRQWRKIISEKDVNNIQQIITTHEKKIEETEEKSKILKIQDSKNYLCDVLDATYDTLLDKISNEELSDFILDNDKKLLRKGIIFEKFDKRSLIWSYMLTKDENDSYIEKILYDITMPDHWRMVWYNKTLLVSVGELYIFNMRKLETYLKLEIKKML